MDLTTILSSGVVAGTIAGLVTLRTAERNIAIENITKQRAIWREKIREKSLEVTKAFLAKDEIKLLALYNEFLLLLNPFDSEDKLIMDVLWELKSSEPENRKLIEFSERLSLLLKHDWERAKREAKPIFFRGAKPKRKVYGNFKNKRKIIAKK